MSLTVPRLDGALCAQIDPEIWFPTKGGTPTAAKTICCDCPVMTECLDFSLATGEWYGIWGGQTEHRRRQIAKERGILPQPIPIPGGHNDVALRRDSVRRLRDQGLDIEAIAQRLGISDQTIYRDLAHLAAQDLDLSA